MENTKQKRPQAKAAVGIKQTRGAKNTSDRESCYGRTTLVIGTLKATSLINEDCTNWKNK